MWSYRIVCFPSWYHLSHEWCFIYACSTWSSPHIGSTDWVPYVVWPVWNYSIHRTVTRTVYNGYLKRPYYTHFQLFMFWLWLPIEQLDMIHRTVNSTNFRETLPFVLSSFPHSLHTACVASSLLPHPLYCGWSPSRRLLKGCRAYGQSSLLWLLNMTRANQTAHRNYSYMYERYYLTLWYGLTRLFNIITSLIAKKRQKSIIIYFSAQYLISPARGLPIKTVTKVTVWWHLEVVWDHGSWESSLHHCRWKSIIRLIPCVDRECCVSGRFSTAVVTFY